MLYGKAKFYLLMPIAGRFVDFSCLLLVYLMNLEALKDQLLFFSSLEQTFLLLSIHFSQTKFSHFFSLLFLVLSWPRNINQSFYMPLDYGMEYWQFLHSITIPLQIWRSNRAIKSIANLIKPFGNFVNDSIHRSTNNISYRARSKMSLFNLS